MHRSLSLSSWPSRSRSRRRAHGAPRSRHDPAARHGLTAPDRLALADGHRGSVRDRRRQAGRRRRPGLELPGARPADEPLRLHAERRGDRRLPPRPRPHLVRPGTASPAQLKKLGIKVVTEPAADNLAAGVRADQPGSAGSPATRRGDVGRRAAMQTRMTAIVASVPKPRRHLRVYHELDQTYYSATSATFIGSIYKLFGFTNIADAADSAARRLSAALGRVHLSSEPADHRPRRHDVLRPDRRDRCSAAGLEQRSRPSKHHRVVGVTTTSRRAGGRGSSTSRGRWRRSPGRNDGARPATRRRRLGSRPAASVSAPAARHGCFLVVALVVGLARRVDRHRARRDPPLGALVRPGLHVHAAARRGRPRRSSGSSARRASRSRRSSAGCSRSRARRTRASSGTRSPIRTSSASPAEPGSARRSRSSTRHGGAPAQLAVPLAAFVGATRRGRDDVRARPLGRRRAMTGALVLAGVTVATFTAAVQTFVQQQHTDVAPERLRLAARRLLDRDLERRRALRAVHRASARSSLSCTGACSTS